MLTAEEIWRIAMAQSAADINCAPDDFLKTENVIVKSVIGPGARSYYSEPIALNLVSYGNNVVASVKDGYRETVLDYISRFEFFRCFETPNIHLLDSALEPFGQRTCFMAEYFLPDARRVRPLETGYELRVLTHGDFSGLYTPEWSNALSSARPQLDVLGVGAYDGGRLIGLAGCSADCETMWQIGEDVLPEYRRRGIASAIVSRLAAEVLERGKVPFYCRAWSNIRSGRTAVKCGFVPAWVELTVKPTEFGDKLIGV